MCVVEFQLRKLCLHLEGSTEACGSMMGEHVDAKAPMP